MAERTIFGRIVQKHDIEANWNLATNFIPKKGEIIVYDTEVDASGNTLTLPADRTTPYNYERFKIGDGITLIKNIPFALDGAVEEALTQAKVSGEFDGYTPVRGTDYWTDTDKAEIKAYIDDAILNGEW